MIDRILAIIAPHHCYVCGVAGSVVCCDCKNNIIDESEAICLACGIAAQSNGLCGRCRPGYSRAWMVGLYHSPLGEMIKGMKIIAIREAATVAGELLSRRLPSLPSNVRLVPLPTIASHRRARGFDHTRVMAEELARRTSLSVDRCLSRQSHTMQRGKNSVQRRQQAIHAYKVERRCDPAAIYLLIDDVVTTGASMQAAAKCLRAAGARTVWAISLTRESLDM